jgi:hypothetical protein
MTLPLACDVVRRDHTGMPSRGERHGPRDTTVAVVAVVVEPCGRGLHTARLGALCAMGHGPDALLGGPSHDPALDEQRPGVPLAGGGTLRRVGGLGSRGRGTPPAPVDRAGTARPVGLLSSRGARGDQGPADQEDGLGDGHVSRGEGPPPEPGRTRARPSRGGHGGRGPRPSVALSAACRPAVLSADPAARGGDGSHQDQAGGRMAAPGRRRVGRADLGGVRWGLRREYGGSTLAGAS